MTNRSLCCMPIVTLLVGLLVLSIGFNYVFLEKIDHLTKIINSDDAPVSNYELKQMMKEIERLSKEQYRINKPDIKYNTKTKEPIDNNF